MLRFEQFKNHQDMVDLPTLNGTNVRGFHDLLHSVSPCFMDAISGICADDWVFINPMLL
jgi:hypothetical protein